MSENENGTGVFDGGDAATALDLMIANSPDLAAARPISGEDVISIIGETERAEIDMMIATAKRYPRQISSFLVKARSLACSSPEIAAGCSYALPRAGKTIIGPSIRLAEIVAPSWGNCRYGGRITNIGQKFVSVQGFFYDIENNVGVAVDLRRRITDKNGNRYNDDMIQTTCQAGVSIAIRNAIFHGIPGGYVDAIRREAEDIALGKREGLKAQREKAVQFFKDEHGIQKKDVLRTLGIGEVEDMTWGHVSRLIGFRTAIATGESTAAQIFSEQQMGEAVEPPAPRKRRKKAAPAKDPEAAEDPGATEGQEDDPKDGEAGGEQASATGIDPDGEDDEDGLGL